MYCSHHIYKTKTIIKLQTTARWFKVTLLSQSWRSLDLWTGHSTIPKKSQRIASRVICSLIFFPQSTHSKPKRFEPKNHRSPRRGTPIRCVLPNWGSSWNLKKNIVATKTGTHVHAKMRFSCNLRVDFLYDQKDLKYIYPKICLLSIKQLAYVHATNKW